MKHGALGRSENHKLQAMEIWSEEDGQIIWIGTQMNEQSLAEGK